MSPLFLHPSTSKDRTVLERPEFRLENGTVTTMQ